MARILIVEDDQIIAADLRLKVERLGHQVIGIASTGEEAIDMAGESQPELVLMDIQLQTAMSGTEAAAIIQERTGASILFITALLGALPRSGISLGKPFSRIQLEAALNAALSRRSRHAT